MIMTRSKMAGATMTNEEETQETGPSQETMDEAARWYYSEIMRQLMDSERFCNWFQVNFDVHKMINEEEKSINIRVMEVPPELVQARMQDQLMEKMKEEVKSRVIVAQPGDVKALANQVKKRRRNKR
jgi:hypothetical protein